MPPGYVEPPMLLNNQQAVEKFAVSLMFHVTSVSY
jgi:hypothetical protein